MRRSDLPSPLLLLTLLTLPSATAGAAEPAADGSAGSPLAAIIVTASREPEPQFEALAPSVVISRDTIERSPGSDVGDLLRFNAGVDVVRSGGPGQQTSLFIRGSNSNHTLVLVDGVRVNPGTKGNAAIQNIAPEFIDHIEVIKGPRSTLYGTDAIGGVVNVITRQPQGSGFGVVAGGGRYDTRQAAASAYYGGDAGSVAAAANWLESAGYPTQVGDPTDRGFRNGSLDVSGRTRLGAVELGARLWGARGNTQYADLYATPIDQDQNFRDSALAVDVGGQVTEALHTRLLLSQAVDDLRQVQSPDYETTRRNTLDWQNSADLGVQKLTFGGLLSREHTAASVFGTDFDVETRSDTWYVEDRASIGPHRLLGAVGYTQHQTFGDHTTWNAEYGYAAGRATLLTAGVGTAFRAPDGTDRYGYAGNPALRPETARNLELGLRQRLTRHQTLALAAFENRIDDLIEFVAVPTVDNPYNGINQNVARARIRGLEAAWEYSDQDWQASATASRQNPLNRADGSMLLRRAKSSATLSLARRLATQQLGFDAFASGPRADVDGFGNPTHDGGYTLVSLFWRAAVGRGLSLQLRLENAFDKRYELASSYFTMRRGLFGALRYDFR
jgi:vitamin B12 transporter